MKTKRINDEGTFLKILPNSYSFRGKALVNELKELQYHIDKYVEGVSSYLVVKYDEICSYCGYNWEEDQAPETLGMPLCCDKAQDEWING